MATPTPMKHAPSQQGRTPSQLAGATPPVSTPFSNAAHAAFSPRGPRSSPQQVKKSPANSSTLMGQPSTGGGLNFDSPSTAAAMRALDMSGGFDLGLDNVGAGGLAGFSTAFSGEDDKVKRLDTILELLNKKKGLVSEAGLSRLTQRLGLELLSDDQTTPDGRKVRALVIAGSSLALDIVLDNNIVRSISLSFHESPPSVARHCDAASQILLKDLQLLPNQSPLTKTLDKFALNFERLAMLDKLSISPGLDCQEALAGIFSSLERLYDWDLSKLREEPDMKDKSDQFLKQMAMTTRHGYPVMHAPGRVGLALQYWKELRMVPTVDDKLLALSEKQEKVWSLLLGCTSIDGLGFLPVRVSENWISKDIVREDTSTDPKTTVLDWQEPDNVKLQLSDENKDAGMEMLQPDLSTTQVPRVMFTVTFDPPVILPQSDWMRLYSIANVSPPNLDFSQLATFDTMFFPIKPGTKQDPSDARTITRRRQIRVFDENRQTSTRSHRNSLFIYKPIYSQAVTEMPFSHPRQLMEMMPLLRQYAFLSTLLENSFGSNPEDEGSYETSQASPKPKPVLGNITATEELASFLNPDAAPKKQEAQDNQARAFVDANMDVILWVHPKPQLEIVFPARDLTLNITIRILEGGVVEIRSENILDHNKAAKGKGKEITREQLAKALETMEDLCKWVEWIRTRLT